MEVLRDGSLDLGHASLSSSAAVLKCWQRATQ